MNLSSFSTIFIWEIGLILHKNITYTSFIFECYVILRLGDHYKGCFLFCSFSNSPNIHPAIIALGLRYAKGVIVGSNSRCVALLAAMKIVSKLILIWISIFSLCEETIRRQTVLLPWRDFIDRGSLKTSLFIQVFWRHFLKSQSSIIYTH